MRDTMANITLPTVRHPLEAVHSQFEAWRKRRPCRGRIPEALWQAAVGLCEEHSIFEVSRTLRLNYNDLKDRVQTSRDRGVDIGAGPGFVKLGLGTPTMASGCVVEMEAPNGSKMRMSFSAVLRDLDPVDFGRAFWRQGK
jgi:hypothetical protein